MLTIRQMQISDAKDVHEIERLVAINPWSQKLFADCVRVGYECWVIGDEHQISGYSVLSSAVNEAHLLNIGIAPTQQRKGHGTQLLTHMIERAELAGATKIFLEVRASNTIAQAVYERFNFIRIGVREDYYPPGENGEASEDALTYCLEFTAY